MRKVWLILLGVVIGGVATLPFRLHRGSFPLQPAPLDDSLAERELNRVIPAVDIEEMPLDGAVEEIQKLTTARIVVAWDALEKELLDRKTRFSFHGRDVRLHEVMEAFVKRVSRGAFNPWTDFRPAGDRILIDGPVRLRYAIAYDVRDLASGGAMPDNTPPSPLLSAGDQLAAFVKESVRTEVWSQWGTIAQVGGRLYVLADWSTHRQLRQFLQDLRAVHAAPPLPAEDRHRRAEADDFWITPEVSGELELAILKHIDRIDLDGVPLDEAIARLQKASGAVIAADWSDLQAAGITRTSPVSLVARNISLASAIDGLRIKGASGGLCFLADRGVVEIVATNGARGVVTRIYDLRDLLRDAKPSEREEATEALVKLIVDSTSPDTWRDAGGTLGTLREFGAGLIIAQTWSNHEKIAALLNGIRKSGLRYVPSNQPYSAGLFK